jgi:hypothetical protein
VEDKKSYEKYEQPNNFQQPVEPEYDPGLQSVPEIKPEPILQKKKGLGNSGKNKEQKWTGSSSIKSRGENLEARLERGISEEELRELGFAQCDGYVSQGRLPFKYNGKIYLFKKEDDNYKLVASVDISK